MHKIVGLFACLFFAGCATPQSGGGNAVTAISETAKTIQAYTRAACSFVPTVNTIAQIVAKDRFVSARTMAQDLCDAVTTTPLSQGGSRNIYVRGVKVEGTHKGRKI
jgi:hypothetical protein